MSLPDGLAEEICDNCRWLELINDNIFYCGNMYSLYHDQALPKENTCDKFEPFAPDRALGSGISAKDVVTDDMPEEQMPKDKEVS